MNLEKEYVMEEISKILKLDVGGNFEFYTSNINKWKVWFYKHLRDNNIKSKFSFKKNPAKENYFIVWKTA